MRLSRWMAASVAVALLGACPLARATTGPIAAFAFDEGSGARAADASGHGHTGTLYGDLPEWVAGVHGSALHFDGGASQDGVLFGPVNTFDGVATGTIEAWVKLDANAAGYHMWFDARDQSGCVDPLELAIEVVGGVTYVETWASSSGCSVTLQSRVPLANPSQWHHLAYVVSGAGNAWYVDGALQSPSYPAGSAAVPFFLASAGASPNTVYDIGGADLQSEEFQGSVDDVRIYDRPLSQGEIQADMRTPVGAPPACSDGVDNDGDGLIDYPQDPGCSDPSSNIENPQCQDGIDNDGDGWIDFDGGASANHGVARGFPDPQCTTPYASEGGGGCGIGAELAPLLLVLRWRWRGVRAGGRGGRGTRESGATAG